jgi:predicted site-specific integrase-resolvase
LKYYSIGEFSNLTCKSIQTLRNWDKKGILKPHKVAESGHRYYLHEQLNQFYGLKPKNTKRIIGYCRVSSNKQKDDLERQEEQELVEDMIQIVTVFACRLQAKRANKAKKFISEVMKDD